MTRGAAGPDGDEPRGRAALHLQETGAVTSKLLLASPERTWVLVFQTGDEVMQELSSFARTEGLSGTRFTGIGAFRDVVLGYFEWDLKTYRRIPVEEQVELVSLAGDIASGDEGPVVHAHVVVARRDGSALGGHLLAAHVRPTAEVVVTESPRALVRHHDPATGLPLIDLGAS